MNKQIAGLRSALEGIIRSSRLEGNLADELVEDLAKLKPID